MTNPLGPTLPEAVANNQVNGATIRIGKVTSFDSGYIDVAVSGTSVITRCAYLIGSYDPAVGDLVVMSRQGSQWVVLGQLSSNPTDNAVENGSFEDIDLTTGLTAPGWTAYIPAGQSVDVSMRYASVYGFMLDGQYAAWIDVDFINDASTTATGQGTFISDPFSVHEGEVWAASGWMTVEGSPNFPFAETNGTLTMIVYENAADTYPTGTPVAFSSLGGSLLVAPKVWLKKSNSFPGVWRGLTIPANGNWARMILTGSVTRQDNPYSEGTVSIIFDRISAVRMS